MGSYFRSLPVQVIPEKLYNHIRGRYRKYSKYLKLLAEEFNIQELRLTSYVSRHTMAMTMQRNKIQRDVISQVLGHADLKNDERLSR